MIFVSCSSPDEKRKEKSQIEKDSEVSSGLTSPNKIGETSQEKVIDLEKGEFYPIDLNDWVYGIGILIMNRVYEGFSEDDTVKIHNVDNSIYVSFNYTNKYFSIEDSIYDLYYVDNDVLEKKTEHVFKPRSFYPEYHTIHLEVLRKGSDYYEVLIDPKNGLTKRVKMNLSGFTYYSWEEYLKTIYLSFDSRTNPLKESPSEQSIVVYKYNDYFFKAIEVKGDWIKVKCSDCKLCDKGDLTGWVKWKDGKKLLIEIGIVC